MKIDDILLCTFEGDVGNPPTDYVAEITLINTNTNTFECRFVDSGQQMTFNYSREPWDGTDTTGTQYSLASHYIYAPGKTDPIPQDAAVVAFADNNRYLCYVKSIDPSVDVTFYHYPYPELSFENDWVTKSNWDAYPVGSPILSIEGCILNTDLPEATSPATAEETHQQYLFVDVYALDLHGKPDWDVLVNTPKFFGAILKSTEGVHYDGGDWFKKNWPAVKTAGADRYGKTWFRGAYHFLKFNQDGAQQADYYLANIDAAGGWDGGDIIPIIDVELGNDGSKNPSKRNSNRDASAQQIIDCTSACAERLRSRTGRRVMLYGRGAMRDKAIKSRMSCDIVWNPSYTAKMVRNGLEAWNLSDIALWQYCGDGVAAFDEAKLPRSVPNFGKVDISVYIDGANKPTHDSLIARLGIGT
jgi:GH25 family lysozyme M1 (1,4-beta-N-acetylmuramidase)